MDKKILSVQEILNLEDIEKNEKKFYNNNGYMPFNVSTWNPSEYFLNTFLLNRIHLKSLNPIPYLYSHDLDKYQLNYTKEKIGGNQKQGCIITNTGTASISLVTSVLKEIGIKKILVICPTYYSALYNFLQKEMQIYKSYMIHTKKGFKLPQNEILELIDDIDAIWITNPIYNTGSYWLNEDIDFLKLKIPSNVMIICDDCFSTNGYELIRKFSSHENFISIHDPFKQIMVNGLKFSCVIFSSLYQNIFDQWSDIICGSLSYSTVQSMYYYNSNEFDEIRIQLHNHFIDVNKGLERYLKYFTHLYMDKNYMCGHMRMCYFKNLSHDFLMDNNSMYNFIENTYASIIPGNRSHFPDTCGFCFRINLARECEEFWNALNRIFHYLSSYID